MSHFSYSCKIKRENGISCLISTLCVNCKFTSECNSGIFQKYSRNVDYSTIWLCIWYGLLQKLEKDKIWPFCLHLNSQVPLNCEDTSRYICWMLQKYFRMLITQESGCASETDCFRNLNSSLKIQKPELFIWNLMVKYWSDRVKFWIYTAFKAFWTSHQLLSTVVVYRSNKGMRVWVKMEDVLTVVPVPDVLIIHISEFWNHPNGW